MFLLHLAATFRIGQCASVHINGTPAIVCWRDASTLVINGADPRTIELIERGGVDGAGRPIMTFTCGDAEAEPEPAL